MIDEEAFFAGDDRITIRKSPDTYSFIVSNKRTGKLIVIQEKEMITSGQGAYDLAVTKGLYKRADEYISSIIF